MRVTRFLFVGILLVTVVFGFTASALEADIPCVFKAEGEQVDMKILIGKKTIWIGTLTRAETKTVHIPEGEFTVMSQVYNPNLNRKEEVLATSHTNRCKEKQPLPVPLFSSAR